ncbi:Uncharacterised protein [Odoribacter splanchnicus]|jgi:hypothetical protein|uniref:hypothetical protein n=1 Tax=Odoribacter splanchnicus TaxID=28118 RepID=UPI000D85C46E|nr:hypothetical protein [Odoribacter splanchnicus]SPY23626.1 Uncharacterised protein [Odoribacter splanchnicus]
MDFDAQIAREIIDKYNLSEKTLRVWKSRGHIPEQYSREEYKKVNPISESADKIIQERIISVLNMPEINRRTVIKLANCDITRVNGVCAHKNTFTKEEMFSLEKEIKRLRLDILKYTENFSESFLKLVGDKRLKLFVVLKDRSLAKRLSYISKTNNLAKYEYEQAVDYYIKVAIQLNIN